MTNVLPSVVAGLALASFAVYTAAIQWFFARPDGVQPGMRVIAVCGGVFAFLHIFSLYLSPASHESQIIGLACYIAGFGLFTWAWNTTRSQPLPLAFSRVVPGHTVSLGPYAWLSHPFYTAYSLTWLGGAVATNTWLTRISAILMIGLYFWAAKVDNRFRAGNSAHMQEGH